MRSDSRAADDWRTPHAAASRQKSRSWSASWERSGRRRRAHCTGHGTVNERHILAGTSDAGFGLRTEGAIDLDEVAIGIALEDRACVCVCVC